MAGGLDGHHGDDAEIVRALSALPRYPAPGGFRSALAEALAPPSARRARASFWFAPAASALAMAMIMLLWIAPSLPTAAASDPLRPLARAVINEHSRTILWGESRPDVVTLVLPRAMDESGVALNWVFAGDDHIQLVNAQPIYLEGRRGMELAYQDVDGHTVTYVDPAASRARAARAGPRADRSVATARPQGQRLCDDHVEAARAPVRAHLRSRLRRGFRQAQGVLHQGPLVDGAVRDVLSSEGASSRPLRCLLRLQDAPVKPALGAASPHSRTPRPLRLLYSAR